MCEWVYMFKFMLSEIKNDSEEYDCRYFSCNPVYIWCHFLSFRVLSLVCIWVFRVRVNYELKGFKYGLGCKMTKIVFIGLFRFLDRWKQFCWVPNPTHEGRKMTTKKHGNIFKETKCFNYEIYHGNSAGLLHCKRNK